MCHTLREIPYITGFKNLSSEATVLINTGQQEGAVVDESPLGLDTKVSNVP
jgi:hypothetical protein